MFIVGHPRSGTTLLATIIDRNPDMCVTPETQYLIEHGIADNALPIEQFEALLNQSRVADLQLPCPQSVERFAASDCSAKAAFETILACYLEMKGGNRICEKSPLHLWHAETLLSWFEDAKIICIERDGRDVVGSLLKMPWSHRNVARHAIDWQKSITLAEKFERAFGERFLRVKYDQLLSDPEQTVMRICNFAGLNYVGTMLEPTGEAATVPDWERRWKSNALGKIQRLGGAKRRLSPFHSIVFESIAYGALERAGYSPAPWAGLTRLIVWAFAWPWHPKARPYFQNIKRWFKDAA